MGAGMSTYTIREEKDGRFVIITPAGNLARTTNSEVFTTRNPTLADESLAYLNQDVGLPARKRVGTQRMKSIWGVF
jgi:hypothetical protein